MKVKISLKFRGREMAHTEFGFQVVNKFLAAIAPYGQPDFAPKLIGRGINVMISPLPRNKRAKNPREGQALPEDIAEEDSEAESEEGLEVSDSRNGGIPVHAHRISESNGSAASNGKTADQPMAREEVNH
jgi:translation initiation factor IF-3